METLDNTLVGNNSLSLEQEATPYLYFQAGLAISNYLSPFLFIIGFFGNTLSLIVMLLRHNRQLACCVYLAGLAISDTITVTSILHLWIVTTLLDRRGTNLECRIIAFFFHTGAGSSTFTIVAVTLDRFLAICFPHTYRKIQSRQRAYTIEICIFIVSFIVCIPFGLNACFLSESVCSGMNGYSSLIMEIYAIFIIIIFSITPFVAICSMNIAIIKKLSKLQQKKGSYQVEQRAEIAQKSTCISEGFVQARIVKEKRASAGNLNYPEGETSTANYPPESINSSRTQHSHGSLDISVLEETFDKPSKNIARSGRRRDPKLDQSLNRHPNNKRNVKNEVDTNASVRICKEGHIDKTHPVLSRIRSGKISDIVESPSESIIGGNLPPHSDASKAETLATRRTPLRTITVTNIRQPPGESLENDGSSYMHNPEPGVIQTEYIEEQEEGFPELKEEDGQGEASVSKATWRKRFGGLNAVYRFRARGTNVRSSNLDKQLSRLLLLVSCTFLVLTLPQYIRYTVYTFKDMKSTPRSFATYFLFYHISQKLYLANSAINFILYCIGTARFRQDAKKLIFFWIGDNA